MICRYCNLPIDPEAEKIVFGDRDSGQQIYAHRRCEVADYLKCSLQELDEDMEKLKALRMNHS
jgi:hypothetical protein